MIGVTEFDIFIILIYLLNYNNIIFDNLIIYIFLIFFLIFSL